MKPMAAENGIRVHARPMWQLLVALPASVLTTAIIQGGSLAALSNATVLFDLVASTLGALLVLATTSVVFFSVWKPMRNSRARREIIFWWCVALPILMLIPRAIVPRPETPEAQSQIPEIMPTMEDWNAKLSQLTVVQSTQAIEDGKSLSHQCIVIRASTDCIDVNVIRDPFEQSRQIKPYRQEDAAESSESPRLAPYISLPDGGLPYLALDVIPADLPAEQLRELVYTYGHSREITYVRIVIDDQLALGAPTRSWAGQSRRLSVELEPPALYSISDSSSVMVQFRRMDDSEVYMNDQDAALFASDFASLVKVRNALVTELVPVVASADARM